MLYLESKKDCIVFTKPYETVCTSNFSKGHVEWFKGGKLNASFNSIDVHLADRADKTVLDFEEKSYQKSTFS